MDYLHTNIRVRHKYQVIPNTALVTTPDMKKYIKYILGVVDYIFRPKLKKKLGGPFNGQEFRKQIFSELIQKCNFTGIIETGSFRGTTTKFMSRSSRLPIYTTEMNQRYFAYTYTRFFLDGQVKVFQSDSRKFLRWLGKNNLDSNERLFIYLDAHWKEDLPLEEEIRIISNVFPNSIVMVDDFAVPGDEGYGFDDYGVGKALNIDYLQNVMNEFNLKLFFPQKNSDEETGYKRGCVVFPVSQDNSALLNEIETLRSL